MFNGQAFNGREDQEYREWKEWEEWEEAPSRRVLDTRCTVQRRPQIQDIRCTMQFVESSFFFSFYVGRLIA